MDRRAQPCHRLPGWSSCTSAVCTTPPKRRSSSRCSVTGPAWSRSPPTPWPRPPPLRSTPSRPLSTSCAPGCRSAAITARDSRCLAMSAIPWPSAARRRSPTTTRPSSVPIRPTDTATAAMPACRWTQWHATCATASSSRWSSPSRSSPGRWSAPACWAPNAPHRSAWTTTFGRPAQSAHRPVRLDDLLHRRRRGASQLDVMVLVAVAIGTAWLYSVAATFLISRDVFYESAGMLATFVLLGHWFEMRARGGANDAVRALLDLAPPKAVVIRDGEPVEVPTADVQVGDMLLIRPGAKIPADATVEDGESQVDESTVTGESLPVKKSPGHQLIGATINKNGTLRARATAVGSDTALAQVVKLVQEAQNSKAPGQRLADRAAFWLVLVALIGGTLTFVVWYFVGRDVQDALLFAITVVVITCPDALGLATPTAIMVGTGLGAKRGILFKHAMGLEQAASLDTVVLDKTGTLTRGEPEVVAVATIDGADENEVLRLVAAAEGDSEHPLAEALVKAAFERGLQLSRAESFEAVPGHGLLATVDGRRLAVG